MAFECLRCGNCCSQYYITVLPEERDKEAEYLNVGVQEFTQKYTILYLQLFPSDYPKGDLKIPSSKLPKKFQKKIIAHKGFLAPYFMALPCIAFKRIDKKCIFYDSKNKECKIHSCKPEQCNLFPLLTTAENPDWKELYPFCEGLKLSREQHLPNKGEPHYKKISDYFGTVGKEGFKSFWNYWPSSGVLAYKDKLVGKITEKEFFSIIEH